VVLKRELDGLIDGHGSDCGLRNSDCGLKSIVALENPQSAIRIPQSVHCCRRRRLIFDYVARDC
jgi:hypothetical protein